MVNRVGARYREESCSTSTGGLGCRYRLATGLKVHYAEQGDPGSEAIIFLPPAPTPGTPTAESCPCSRPLHACP